MKFKEINIKLIKILLNKYIKLYICVCLYVSVGRFNFPFEIPLNRLIKAYFTFKNSFVILPRFLIKLFICLYKINSHVWKLQENNFQFKQFDYNNSRKKKKKRKQYI